MGYGGFLGKVRVREIRAIPQGEVFHMPDAVPRSNAVQGAQSFQSQIICGNETFKGSPAVWIYGVYIVDIPFLKKEVSTAIEAPAIVTICADFQLWRNRSLGLLVQQEIPIPQTQARIMRSV